MIDVLIITAIVCTGTMAGIYFAFSVFVMRALSEVSAAVGIGAMNSINRVILRTAFIPLFFVSTMVLIVLAIAQPNGLTMGAALSYCVGMTLVTALGNVPLNNALRDASLSAREAVWQQYLAKWTRWNHMRTLSSLIACLLLCINLV